MNNRIPAISQVTTLLGAMTDLKSRHYVLPRYADLENAFESVLAQFVSGHLAGLHHEGRGMIVTGGTRAGKSHDIKYLLRAFAEAGDPLQGGYSENMCGFLCAQRRHGNISVQRFLKR